MCSITRAELRVAAHGLQLAWNKGYKRVIVQLDSITAIITFVCRRGDYASTCNGSAPFLGAHEARLGRSHV
ncbi:hypothetical protein LINPERHAP1_LOCUS20309 [Linum perenne]